MEQIGVDPKAIEKSKIVKAFGMILKYFLRIKLEKKN